MVSRCGDEAYSHPLRERQLLNAGPRGLAVRQKVYREPLDAPGAVVRPLGIDTVIDVIEAQNRGARGAGLRDPCEVVGPRQRHDDTSVGPRIFTFGRKIPESVSLGVNGPRVHARDSIVVATTTSYD